MLMSFELFYKELHLKYYIITCIKKAKYRFTNEMNCDVVGNGIIDCVARSEYRVVEIPLYREHESRINNKCSQSFLRRIDSADHRSRYGTGMSAGCFLILYIHGC